MIPITAGLLGGTGGPGTIAGRDTSCSRSVYALGLALVYATLGLLAGLTGSIFGTISSNPWAYFVMGNLLLVFGLAMLDVFSVDAPSGVLAWASSIYRPVAGRRLFDGSDLRTGGRAVRSAGLCRGAHLRGRNR